MNMVIPKSVQTVLDRLEQAGFEAYAVGGCVRDSLLGRIPQDWDVTTDALPEQTLAVFAGERVLQTGLQHGTVTVLCDDMPIEVTTYRVDGTYSDNRHPDTVYFVRRLREDLARRDLTVNAMAYHPRKGLIDPFEGQKDLAAARIRCVGEPDRRFEEDALRILRTLRFAAVLGFTIDEATQRSIRRQYHRLSQVAAERKAMELTKLVCGDNAFAVLRDFPEVTTHLLPPLQDTIGFAQNNPHHCYDVYTHSLYALAHTPPILPLRLAALLHDCGKPACYTQDAEGIGHFYGHAAISAKYTEDCLWTLRLDHDTVCKAVSLVNYHDLPLIPERRILRRRLNRFGEETLRALIALQRADIAALSPVYADRQRILGEVEQLLADILQEGDCVTLQALAVKGIDLLEMGIPAGKEIGRLLQQLLEAVMDGRCPNERDALLRLVKTLI